VKLTCALARPPQDFKTAHLLGVCPRAQFFAMLLGSAASALVSVAAYTLYTAAWPVPGPEFPAPTAEIWLDMADLVRARAPAQQAKIGALCWMAHACCCGRYWVCPG
jgi:uncharacterized oligopeptide transporter (OPT) family protein